MIRRAALALAACLLMLSGARAAQWEVFAGPPLTPPGARLLAPRAVAVAPDGVIYFTDGGALRALYRDGAVRTLAGVPEAAGYRDGQGAQARFHAPAGLALAADGTLFVADSGNHVLRAVTPDGQVRTLAGQAGQPGRSDGHGAAARFHHPLGVALDSAGALLVADSGNGVLRRVGRDGGVATLAHRLLVPAADGRPAYAMAPQGVAVDAQGAVAVNDERSVLRLRADGTVRALQLDHAGAPEPDGVPCVRGKCLRRYQAPSAAVAPDHAAPAVNLAAHPQGGLVAAAPAMAALYRIDEDGLILPLLGRHEIGAPMSGTAFDAEGRLYALLAGRAFAGRWDLAGQRQDFGLRYRSSLNRDGPARLARFGDVRHIALGHEGALYVLDGDQVRRIDRNGIVRTLLEEGGFRRLREWNAAQIDRNGVLVPRPSTGVYAAVDGTLARISAEGDIAFVSGPPGQRPDDTGLLPALRQIWAYARQDVEPYVLPGLGRHGIAADAGGEIRYCADNVLWRIRVRGVARKTVLQGADGCGDVLVSPSDDVLMLHGHFITRVGDDGHQSVVAGSRERRGLRDGAGLLARFDGIASAAYDAQGMLYVVDKGGVRSMAPDGTVSTEVGVTGRSHGRLLDLPAALGAPRAVAPGPKGVLYIAVPERIIRVLQSATNAGGG